MDYIHFLLNSERLLGAQGFKVPLGHRGTFMPQLVLERLGVAGHGQPCDGPGVAQYVDCSDAFRLGDPCKLKCPVDDPEHSGRCGAQNSLPYP